MAKSPSVPISWMRVTTVPPAAVPASIRFERAITSSALRGMR